MLPKTHIALGFLFSLGVLILFPGTGIVGAIIIFLSSFLVDFDHYMVYVKREKQFSLKKAYSYFTEMAKKIYSKEKEYTGPLMIFHTIEFVILLLLLSLFAKFLFYVAIGIIFHIFLDMVDLSDKDIMHAKYFSLIDYYRSKNKKIQL